VPEQAQVEIREIVRERYAAAARRSAEGAADGGCCGGGSGCGPTDVAFGSPLYPPAEAAGATSAAVAASLGCGVPTAVADLHPGETVLDLCGGTGDLALAVARAGLTGGLMLAFVFAWHRLRPRPGWGVTLSPRGVLLARPLTGSQLHLAWGQIDAVRRLGHKGDTLGLFLDEGARVLVTRHLFPSRRAFGELASALEERKPAPRYDA